MKEYPNNTINLVCKERHLRPANMGVNGSPLYLTILSELANLILITLISCQTHHAFNIIFNSSNGGTLGGMPIAEAVATDDQLIDGIVVLLFDLNSRV